jgi:hypothetical protein
MLWLEHFLQNGQAALCWSRRQTAAGCRHQRQLDPAR